MIFTRAQSEDILAAGGNLIINAVSYTFPDLRNFAKKAALGNSKVTIKNLQAYTADQLIQLAKLAPGLITFDLSN
jgi:hypothetical protein